MIVYGLLIVFLIGTTEVHQFSTMAACQQAMQQYMERATPVEKLNVLRIECHKVRWIK